MIVLLGYFICTFESKYHDGMAFNFIIATLQDECIVFFTKQKHTLLKPPYYFSMKFIKFGPFSTK